MSTTRVLARDALQAEVVRACEVTRQSAMSWVRMQAGDPQAWRREPLARPAGLDEEQLKGLSKQLLDGALANGLATELWTVVRVAS